MGVEAEFRRMCQRTSMKVSKKRWLEKVQWQQIRLEILRSKYCRKAALERNTNGFRNRSSAPGETPAPQSGKLRQDWDDQTLIEGDQVTSRIKSNSKHAEWLEDGTKIWQNDHLWIQLRRKQTGDC